MEIHKTRVVNLRKEKYDVYIGRGRSRDGRSSGCFGNPFPITQSCSRQESIQKYKEYFYDKIKKDPEFKKIVDSLRGKILGCFCKPEICHGDVIVDYLERTDK